MFTNDLLLKFITFTKFIYTINVIAYRTRKKTLPTWINTTCTKHIRYFLSQWISFWFETTHAWLKFETLHMTHYIADRAVDPFIIDCDVTVITK